MRKKQILKLGNSKKGKMMGSAVLSLVLIGMVAGSAGAADTSKTSYRYLSSNMRAFDTETRNKYDASPVEIMHQGDSQVSVQVRSGNENYTYNGSAIVSVGQTAKITNYVNQTAQKTCYLRIAPTDYGTFQLYGKWSPDSK